MLSCEDVEAPSRMSLERLKNAFNQIKSRSVSREKLLQRRRENNRARFEQADLYTNKVLKRVLEVWKEIYLSGDIRMARVYHNRRILRHTLKAFRRNVREQRKLRRFERSVA